MEDIICARCGAVNDYRTEQTGPHIKAVCNGCDRYIKFIRQHHHKPADAEDYLRGFSDGWQAAIESIKNQNT